MRAGDEERVHVESEVEQVRRVVDERHRPQPVVLAHRDRALVELEGGKDPVTADRHRGNRHDDRQPDDQPRQRERRAAAAATGEVAPRRASVAGLLGQPAQPGCDLCAVLLRGPTLRLAIGGGGALEVALAHARRSDVAPREIRAGRLR